MALGSTQTLVKMSTRNIPGGKGGRCVRLTTSPPSRAEWKYGSLKPPGTLWATPGLLPDSFTLSLNYLKRKKPLQVCADLIGLDSFRMLSPSHDSRILFDSTLLVITYPAIERPGVTPIKNVWRTKWVRIPKRSAVPNSVPGTGFKPVTKSQQCPDKHTAGLWLVKNRSGSCTLRHRGSSPAWPHHYYRQAHCCILYWNVYETPCNAYIVFNVIFLKVISKEKVD
jgi:hypothetical protein